MRTNFTRGETTSTTSILVGLLLLIIIGIGCIWVYDSSAPPEIVRSPSELIDEAKIRTTVRAFGRQMQMVSLTSNSAAVSDAMAQYYNPYLTPEALLSWQQDQTKAIGRLTSSPWPDHIDVTSLEKNANGTYSVVALVTEVTSDVLTTGGGLSTYPITLLLEKRDGAWLISSVTRGTE